MRYEMYRTVFREVGGLLIILGLAMLLPMLISLIFAEWHSAGGFLGSAICTAGIGYILYKIFLKSAAEPEKKHAMIIAAFGWLMIALFGAIPFYLIAHITPPEIMQGFVPAGESYQSSLYHFRNPLHAIFESMSGFTTTGLTMSVHEPSVGKGILFYRSLTQWIGGAGIIVMTLAVLQDKPDPGLLSLYSSESTGIKLKPTVIGTARAIWKLYLGLTLFQIVYLIIGTLIILPDYPISDVIFDGVNHALTGQATGGFSPLDDSIASYNSYPMEVLLMLPMIMGALAFPFYFKVIYEKKTSALWKDIQTRTLLPFFLIGGVLLSLLLFDVEVIKQPFREGIFQFVSGLSQTGWQTSAIGEWNAVSVLFIVSVAMFIGGAVGSTVGGIKIKRALLIQKGLRWQVAKIFFPDKMIQNVKFDHERLLPKEMNEKLAQASTFAFTYLILIFLSTIITAYFMEGNFTMQDALFEAASAQGTVGMTAGITGPNMSPIIECTYIVTMWAGRLEILPLIILLRALILGVNPRVI